MEANANCARSSREWRLEHRMCGKDLGASVDHQLRRNLQDDAAAEPKGKCIGGCVSRGSEPRSREGLAPLHATLVTPHLEYHLQVRQHPGRLEPVQRRAVVTVRSLATKSREEWAQELGVCSLMQKKSLPGGMRAAFKGLRSSLGEKTGA